MQMDSHNINTKSAPLYRQYRDISIGINQVGDISHITISPQILYPNTPKVEDTESQNKVKKNR